MMYWTDLLPTGTTSVEVVPIRPEDQEPHALKVSWACAYFVYGIEKRILEFLVDTLAGPDPLIPQKVMLVNMFGDGLYTCIIDFDFSEYVYNFVLDVTAWVPRMAGNYDWTFPTVDDFILFDQVYPGMRLNYGIVDQ